MAEKSIATEVRKFIADKIKNGEPVMVDWLTHEIVSGKSAIEGADEQFYRVCAYAHLRDVVKRCIGKYDTKPITDNQLVLDGFEHLQVAHTTERVGQTILVPVDQLTDAELLSRATEYDLMAAGCKAHAREIRFYVAARSVERAGDLSQGGRR